MDRVADDDEPRAKLRSVARRTTVRSLAFGLEADGGRRVEPPAAAPRVGVSGAGRVPASAAAAAAHASSGSAASSAQSSGGQIRSSVSIRASPSRTTGWRTSQRRKRRFVVSPRTTRVVQRRRQAIQRLVARRAVRDDLGQHRVEPARDLVAARDPGVHADPGPGRPAQLLDAAGRRQEPGLRVLGVQPDLDCMSRRRHVGLPEPERFAGRDPQLVLDEVAPGHQLGDRMLDLQPGVHLEEDGFAAVVDEELARAGADVADRARQRERRVAQPLAQRRIDGG